MQVYDIIPFVLILDRSVVDHMTVNHGVVGSSPTRGVFLFLYWLHGQAVKTPPFHGGIRGSNPLGVIYMVT